jgi:hypothetical protein
MDSYNKKVATSLAVKLIKEAYELKGKEKLTRDELKTLRRLRELATLVKVTGV